MTASHTCPSAESLLHLLDARLPESQQLELTEHVDSCETCQEKLESLVTHGLREDLHFEYAGEYLREAGARTTLPPAARQRLTTALSERTTADSAASEELFLELLQSSQEEGSLGRLGQFEITEVIGRGGMGIVLKGRDTRLDRVVALKVLAPEVASNPTARKRFLREAQAAAAVSHDHVVTTFAVEPGKLPYLAMEYIDGQSLQQKIDRDGPLELREILRIGMQTAYGLAAAHTQGLIHRDIKPSNILLQNGVERVQITDFGLARAVDDVSITRTGEVTGTPQYMSPEQAQGRPVDHRADLFSLGGVLYAMCTGRSPFRADSTMAVINRVCNDTPRPIDEVNPDIPAWLSAIIDRSLQKHPDDRFQSAAEVADLLSQCLAHVQQPAVVPLPELLPQINRIEPFLSRRFKWYAGAILLAAVFGSLGLAEATGVTRFSASVISIVRGDGTLMVEVDDPDVSVTIEGEDIVITGAGPKEVRLKPGRYKLKASKDGKTVSLDQQLVTIARGGKQIVRVTLEGENVEAAAGNGRADYTSVPPGAVREVRRFEGHTYFLCPRSLAFTADGREVFSGQTGWWLPTRLALWDVATGTAIRRFDDREAKGGVRCVAVSPTARIGASGHHENGGSLIHLWDLDSGKRVRTLSGHAGLVVALDFSPDGKRLVSVTGGKNADGTARVWDVESGKEIVRGEFAVGGEPLVEIEDPLSELFDVRFSPDGKAFLVAQSRQGVVLCDAQTGRRMNRFDVLKTSAVRTAAFSPDGRYVAAGGQGEYLAIHLYDAQTGKEVRRFAGHSDAIHSVRFTADGRFLVSGAKDKTLRVWDVAAGREVARVLCENHVTIAVAISPNGKHVVSAGGVHNRGQNEHVVEGDYGIRLWRLPESVWPENADYKSIPQGAIAEIRRLKSPSSVGFIRSLDFSSDGRHLLCGRGGPVVEYWGLDNFQASYLENDGPTAAIAISPDARWAAQADYEPPFAIRLWDLDKGVQVRQFLGHTNYARCLSFSPGGKRLLSGGSEATARIWDVQTGEELRRIVMDEKVCFSVFSPDGRTALIGYREFALVDVESGKELWRRDPPGHSFTAAFSPDGKLVAAAFQDHGSHEIQLFEAATGEKKRRLLGHSWIVRNLCFLPDGRHLISGSSDKTLRLWHVATGKEVARLEAVNHFTSRLAVSPDGRTVATGGGHFTKPPGYKMRAHDMPSRNPDYAKDGDDDIRLWRLPESVWPKKPSADYRSVPAGAISQFDKLERQADIGPVNSLVYSPDGKQLLCGRSGKWIEYWNLEKREPAVFLPDEPLGSTTAVAISPDGDLAATAHNSDCGITQIWDVKTGSPVRQLRGHASAVRKVRFCPDGKLLITGGADRIARIWDIETGNQLHEFSCLGHVYIAAFSPDGQSALFGGKELALIDVATGDEVWRIEPEGTSFVGEFSPDGKSIVTAFSQPEYREIQIADAATGKTKKRFIGHTWGIRSATFLPDGGHIISGSTDKTLRIWDVQTGEEAARLETDDHITHHLAVSPDGRAVASGGGHFQMPPGYKMRAHDIQQDDSDYARDGDYDIRLWRLPEARARDSSPDSSPSTDSP